MKFLRGFLSFIAFLLCIVLLATTIVTMLVADVRVITSKDNLKTIINQMITGSLSSRNNAASLAAGGVIFWEEESEENTELMDTLIESVYEMLSQQFGNDVPFTQDEVEEFVKESTLPDFISDKAADIINDIYNGELTTTITGEEIKELIEDNKALIEDTLDIKVSNEMVDMVTDWVEKNDVTEKVQEQISQIVGLPAAPETPETPVIPNPGVTVKPIPVPDDDEKQEEGGIVGDVTAAVTNIKELIAAIKNGEKVALPTVLNILRTVTTKNMLIACIGVCLVLVLLIFLCKLDRWYAALRNCGTVFLLAGIILLLPVGAALLLPELSSLLPDIAGNKATVALIQLVLNMTVTVSGSVALGGLACIIVGSLSGSAVRRKARKKQEAALAAAAYNAYAPVPDYFSNAVRGHAAAAPVAAPAAQPAPVVQPTPVPVAPVTSRCRVCGAELSADSLFCVVCGSSVAQTAEEAAAAPISNRCKVCGAELAEGDLFCCACGSSVEPAAEEVAAEPTGSRCKVCGAKLLEGSLFCMACGSPVEQTAEETAEEATEEAVEETAEETVEEAVEVPAEETAEEAVEAPAEETAEEAPSEESAEI